VEKQDFSRFFLKTGCLMENFHVLAVKCVHIATVKYATTTKAAWKDQF
jgi:hypothetical protein